MDDNFIKLDGSEYGEGVGVEEYNGTISLVLSQLGENGNVYKRWCYPQVGKKGENKPLDKAIPWKISIGNDKRSAIIMLGRLGKIIEDMGAEDDPFG